MTLNTRDLILAKLRNAKQPFTEVPPYGEDDLWLPVVPLDDHSTAALRATFIPNAIKLNAKVHEAESHAAAVACVLDLLGDDDRAMMWDDAYIPLHGLRAALDARNILSAEMRDSDARVGITGVDAALAATGSIAVISGHGKSRQASLLPLIHIAIIAESQITPDLETFYRRLRGTDVFTHSSNIAVISGSSRSADIAQEMIHGMHGPKELHLVIVQDE